MRQDEETHDDKLARFREALAIDRHRLDDCVEQHAQLYLDVQEAHVLAESIRDENKTATEEVYAEVSSKLRRDWEKVAKKYTEGALKESVAVDDTYLNSAALYLESKKKADMLSAMVKAYDQRGRMLGRLAELYQSGYFVLSQTRRAQEDTKDADAARARELLAEGRKNRPFLRRDK